MDTYDYQWLTTTQDAGGVAWTPPAFPYSTGTVTLGPGQVSSRRSSTAGTASFFASSTGFALPVDAYIVGVGLVLWPTSVGAGLVNDYAELVVGGVGLGDIHGSVPLAGPTMEFGGPTYLGGHAWTQADLATVTWRYAARQSGGGTTLLGVDGVVVRFYVDLPPSGPPPRTPMRVFGTDALRTR